MTVWANSTIYVGEIWNDYLPWIGIKYNPLAIHMERNIISIEFILDCLSLKKENKYYIIYIRKKYLKKSKSYTYKDKVALAPGDKICGASAS